MDSLLRELREGNAQQRRQAVWALGDFEDDKALDAVTTALKGDADAEVRQRAAWLLEFSGGREAMSALAEAVAGDPDESVTRSPVKASSRFPAPKHRRAIRPLRTGTGLPTLGKGLPSFALGELRQNLPQSPLSCATEE